jgi:hypothetical protein
VFSRALHESVQLSASLFSVFPDRYKQMGCRFIDKDGTIAEITFIETSEYTFTTRWRSSDDGAIAANTGAIAAEAAARTEGDDYLVAISAARTLTGAVLARRIGFVTSVSKSLFPAGMPYTQYVTPVTDGQGTEGVIVDTSNDGLTLMIQTTSISPIGTDEPTLLGNVPTFADLPATQTDCMAVFGRNADVDDYAKVIADETHGGATTEYYINLIDAEGYINWANPIIINTSDYQQQSGAADAGKLLVGGASAGTYGTSVDPGTFALAADLADTQTELTQEAARRLAADAVIREDLDYLLAPETKNISLTCVAPDGTEVHRRVYAGDENQISLGVCAQIIVEDQEPETDCAFCFHFESGAAPTAFQWNGPFLFAGGEPPQIEANKKYTCVVLFDGTAYRVTVGAFG